MTNISVIANKITATADIINYHKWVLGGRGGHRGEYGGIYLNLPPHLPHMKKVPAPVNGYTVTFLTKKTPSVYDLIPPCRN